MDFSSWAMDNGLSPETVAKMEKEEFNDFEALNQCGGDDIKRLSLTDEQELRLDRAVQNLRCPDKKDELTFWAWSKGLKPETVKQLNEGGISDLDSLRSTPKDNIGKLRIKGGQMKHLTKAIDELNSVQETAPPLTQNSSELGTQSPEGLQDEKFRTLLMEAGAREDTINTLWNRGFRNVEALVSLVQADLDFLEIPTEERKSLRDIKQYYIAQNTPISQGMHADSLGSVTKSNENIVKKYDSMPHGQSSGIGNTVRYLVEKSALDQFELIGYEDGMRFIKLPLEQVFVDKKNKVRKCIIGNPSIRDPEKTVMMMGATGAGKSTLINGLVNHMFGTQWDEIHRIKILDRCEEKTTNYVKSQSQSQTDWITIYTITSSQKNNIPFTLNLIDTPGFGSTEGIQRDDQITQQIRALFEAKGAHGIDSIDTVCFVVKAPDARLTTTQKYIFSSVLSIFGKDIVENIVIIATFADGKTTQIIDAIEEAKVPHKMIFNLNNKALFASNGFSVDHTTDIMISKNLWELGFESYSKFYGLLDELTPISLTLTRDVLDKRRALRETLTHLEQHVRSAVDLMSTLKKRSEIYEKHILDKVKNKDFETISVKMVKYNEQLPKGKRSNYCTKCNETCHNICLCLGKKTKYWCEAFTWAGNCQRCTNQCPHTDHQIVDFAKKTRKERVKIKDKEKLAHYEDASLKAKGQHEIIETLKNDYIANEQKVLNFLGRCRAVLRELEKIALKTNPMTEAEYVDDLIRIEQIGKEPGWLGRVEELKKLQSAADTLRKVNSNQALLPETCSNCYT